VLTIWVGYEVYEAGGSDVPPPGNNAPQIISKGQVTGFIKTKSWTFDYDKVVANGDESIMDLSGIHNGVFFRKGKPYLRLRAQHVTVYMLTKNFIATGPFHIETVDQPRTRALDTTAASWDDGTKILVLANKTTVTTSGGDPPLVAGKITINVRTGDVHIERISGHVAF
jgi:hypothetical protein